MKRYQTKREDDQWALVALAAAARMPSIPKEIIDQFVTGPKTATAVNGLSMAFSKALIERVLKCLACPITWAIPPVLTSRRLRHVDRSTRRA